MSISMKPNADIMERLSDLARRLGTQVIGEDAAFARVITDTRQLQPGDLFVALKGDKFDGNDFALRAMSLGAAACLLSREVPGVRSQIVVPDTLAALQAYAASWRKDLDIPVVAVTGSNGKTTTKQLLASVFAARGPVLATEGNLNNHIGVPLTLLRLRAMHRTAVIEMGANHCGEIAVLAAMATPDVGIVTMAGDAHLEGFGSHEGIARGKGEMFQGLQGRGVAIINADDKYAPLWRELAGTAPMISFGFTAAADVRADQFQGDAASCRFRLQTPTGEAHVELPLAGRHNVTNALAAAAAGVALGLNADAIGSGLSRVQQAAGRLAWKQSREGARVLDDTYNANPSSLRAAMELLATLPGKRWLVLGDMKELGDSAAELHEQAGRAARSLGIDRLYTLGPLAAHAAEGYGQGRAYQDIDELVAALHADIDDGVTVLVKGSRSSRMERVVVALCGGNHGDTH